MATRKPLALASGIIREVGAGDVLDYSTLPPQVFVQATAPTPPAGQPYIWIHTGLGSGLDFAVLFNDGT